MSDKAKEIKQAKSALTFIVPLLEKYDFKWLITGGFACYVYGVDRKLTDIDIDIETSKDSNKFQKFYKELEAYVTQPLENFIDDNYNNFNFELTYNGQIIDICPMHELMIINKSKSEHQSFYNDGFPKIEVKNFAGIDLPLLSKQAIIENKEMLVKKDKWQQRDIEELRKLISSTTNGLSLS